MKHNIALEAGCYYHIYNRGINGCNLFYETRNYHYFLQKYAYYMCDVVDTYAYCLLKNHFHLLIRVKESLYKDLSGFENLTGLEKGLHTPNRIVSKRFADLFNAYTKSINKAQQRTGALFETPFKRILVEDRSYFGTLTRYIHTNPQKHGFVADFKEYPHSSYQTILATQPTKLAKAEVLDWLGGTTAYVQFHQQPEKGHLAFAIEFD
jgi:REP element-mobilizing transposase RayT